MEHEIEFSALKKFLLGGDADIIITNLASGNHINFLLQAKREKLTHTKVDNRYFLYYMSKSKVYLGSFYIKESIPLVIDTLARIIDDEDRKKFSLFHNLLNFVYKLNKEPKGVKITYTGKCSVCNRELTDPEYIKIGIGKICLKNE